MEIEGNIWKEAWENAKPVPARRQKRLFDDTREAEKTLQYLTALKPSEAAHILMPVLQHAAITRIEDEIVDSIQDQINDILTDATKKLSTASRLRCHPEVKHFQALDESLSSEVVRRATLTQDVQRLIFLAEMKISQALSLQAKFVKNLHKIENQVS